MIENHILSLQNIKKNYEGQPLLKGISLEVHSGEVLCLLGRSGSGKSTLLRIIAGIENADSGSIQWDGENFNDRPVHQRHFGLMFQDYALFPHKNVFENIAFGLRMQNKNSGEIKERVSAVLEQVNMTRFAKRRVTELSGGEQQRVALARTLAPEPNLIMLDEPLAALDRSLREQLQLELRELLHRSGIPAIYVTHDQEEALALGDQMALLNEGTIVQKGKPESLFQNPHNRWVAQFLGVTNIYSAKVISTKPLILQTGFGKFSAYAEGKFSVSSNETIWIAVTQINEISDSFSSSENILQGICLSCLFKGDHYQTQLLLSDQSIFTYSSSHSSQLHEKIILNISPKNIIFLDQ